jgi:hypothetical protein
LGLNAQIVPGELFAAVGARRNHVGDVTAIFVDGNSRDIGMLPLVSEMPHCKKHVKEISSLVGEPILVTRRVVLIRDRLQDPVGDELLESVGEDIARNLEIALEVVEPPYAEEHVANDQQRPPVTDDVDGAGDDAVEVLY